MTYRPAGFAAGKNPMQWDELVSQPLTTSSFLAGILGMCVSRAHIPFRLNGRLERIDGSIRPSWLAHCCLRFAVL